MASRTEYRPYCLDIVPVDKPGRTATSSCCARVSEKRLLAKLKQVNDELRRRMHQPPAEVGKWLRSLVQGYFNYHAVPGNFASLQSFRLEVSKRWLRVLQRRQKSRMSWKHLTSSLNSGFPGPKSSIRIPACASTPSIRGKSRMQETCLCGSVRGGRWATGVPTATRSFDRRDVWVGLKPSERLQASRGRRCREQRKRQRPLARVNGIVCPKKERREQKSQKKVLTRAGIVDRPGSATDSTST